MKNNKELLKKIIEVTARKQLEKLRVKNRNIKTDNFKVIKLPADNIKNCRHLWRRETIKTDISIDYTERMLRRVYGTIFRYIQVGNNVFTSRDIKISEPDIILSDISYKLITARLSGGYMQDFKV